MSIIRRFLKLDSYQPLNLIEISRDNLLHNYRILSLINKKVKITPVLKSNAYGHGIKEIAKILDSYSHMSSGNVNIPFFCVDSIYEAYELLKAKVNTPILIMGYIDPENLKIKKLPFTYAVSTLDLAEAISKYQPHAGVHIFVDTGMHREGVPLTELPHFIRHLKKLTNINIKGLMSHFASADDKRDPLNKTQVKNFRKALEICKKNGTHFKWIHFANSDGLLNYVPTFQVGIQNMARVGLSLYGISSNPILKPILTLKSKIVQIKNLQKGDRVGYDGTFVAQKPMTIGVLPLGYYDGVDRRLSNKGFVTIDDAECPILGLVSMNITAIDITKIINPKVGQEVIVYSNNSKYKNSIQNAAKICKTIPYDLLVHLAPSTKRIII